ncbi:myotubularin-related protein 4 isoform X1 [Tachysurus ichikawai]
MREQGGRRQRRRKDGFADSAAPASVCLRGDRALPPHAMSRVNRVSCSMLNCFQVFKQNSSVLELEPGAFCKGFPLAAAPHVQFSSIF